MTESTCLSDLSPDDLRQAVADRYGKVALDPEASFGFPVGRDFAISVGYDPAGLDALPAAASASFAGVTALARRANAQPGQRVVDLGCGAGLDTLISARAVGPDGTVTGIDLSAEMAALARENAALAGLDNVEIVVAPVEALPLPDGSADLVTANGVFNLAPGKAEAIFEAARVLVPGGRLVGAEIVLSEDIPREQRNTVQDWFK
jgi:arsenite methyltransferase